MIRKYFVNRRIELQNRDRRCVIQGLSSALKTALIKAVIHELPVSIQNFTVSGTLLSQQPSEYEVELSPSPVLPGCDSLLCAAHGRVVCRP